MKKVDDQAQSVIERCAEIEREMKAMTKELCQKTNDLKAFYMKYEKKLAILNTEWHKLFHAIPKDDEVVKAYHALVDDIKREL